jgi:hypothetical protein
VPQGLAVDRHYALDRLGIEQTEHAAEGVVAGYAVLQMQKLPQERLLGLPKNRHVGAILAATQHRT